MKRRSRAGGKASKALGREALKIKRRDASKNAPSSAPIQDAEVARLTRELNEASERQAATSEVLEVISGSPGDLQPVFASMLENAVRICDAKFGDIYRWDGEALHIVATHKTPPAFAEDRRGAPYRPYPQSPIGRMVIDKTVAHISDLTAEEVYLTQNDPVAVSAVALGGTRTLLGVPLLNKDEMIGAFFLSRQEVRPFTEKQIALVKNFAAQAVIAIENARLLNELRQRTTDLTEALEQQRATADLLQVISGSPGNLEPVFHAMLENAVGICGANFGNMFLYQDDAFRTVAMYNAPEAYANARTRAPFHPPSDSGLGRLAATKEVVQIADLRTEESYINRDPFVVAGVELGGIRTLLAVPMLKEDHLVGGIVIYRQEVRPFSEKQIELVRNFARQVVIAIENARLLNELRQRTDDLTVRTTDLTEALEQQTATSEVLQVISSSSGDLQPVFATMLGNAARICDAKFGNIFRWDGDAMHLVATHNTPPAFAEYRKRRPLPLKPNLPFGRMVAAKVVVHCADTAALPAYTEQRDPDVVAAVELGGIRTFVAVPMLKENKLIGAVIVYRQEVRPFTDKQIELVQNLAAQAVIAIENARLLNELRQRTTDLTERTADLTEALEQQTATSEVLQVISGSPGDVEPVFSTMLEKAVRICDASFGNIYRWDGKALNLVATHNTPPAFAEARGRSTLRPGSNSLIGRMLATKAAVHIADVAATQAYEQGVPETVAAVELGGVRTILGVPMHHEGELIGSFTLYRKEVSPFTDKQIALVTNFAAQAVIAIENARLLNELRQRTTDLTEALEQQTATSEVLQVISGSAGDVQPVFEAVLANAVQLCDAKFGTINRWDGEVLHLVATYNVPLAFAEFRRRTPFRPGPENPISRMLMSKMVIHFDDFATAQDYLQRNPNAVAAVELGGVRTFLAVPMLKENDLIGVVIVYRQEVRPFSDKQIELVKNFASQAVIAVENARLLTELRQSLEQQTATADVLKGY